MSRHETTNSGSKGEGVKASQIDDRKIEISFQVATRINTWQATGSSF